MRSLDDVVEWSQTFDPPSQMVERARAFGIDQIDLLIEGAVRSQAVYDAPPGPKSALAAARRLVEYYEVVQSLAILAPRARDGALLKEAPSGPSVLAAPPPVEERPWQPSRPRRIEDIQPFPQVDRWRKTIADAEARALADRLASRPRRGRKSSEPPAQLQSTGRQFGSRGLMDLPFLLYYGNYGKVVTLVKTKDMTFTTEAGRVAILAYLIRLVCGDLRLYTDLTGSIGKDGEATAEQLAYAMLNSNFLGGTDGSIMRVLFTAERNDAALLERLREYESMRILVEVSALKVISQFTPLRRDFVPAAQARPKGCASIQWMQELMRDVPASYRMLWAVRKCEADRGIYRNNMQAGTTAWLPLGEFIPLDDDESKKRQCHFLGSATGTADTVLIMTEEGRILQIDERARDLQSFCTAVLSVAPFIAMSYMVAAVAGFIIAAELAPAVLGELLAGGARVVAPRLAAWEATSAVKWVDALIASRKWEAIVSAGLGAASISFNVNQAGGVTEYLKKLKSPVEAGLLLLDLLSIRGAFKADDLARLIEENRILAQQLERRGLPKQAAVELESGAPAATRALPEAMPGGGQAAPVGGAPSGTPSISATGERVATAAPERTPLPRPNRMTDERLMDARLGSPTSSASTRKELPDRQWPADELAPRRAAKEAAKEAPPVAAPVSMPPKRDPIQGGSSPTGAEAKPGPITAARTEDPIHTRVPADQVGEMRRRRQGAGARAEEEAGEQQAAESALEDMPVAQPLAAGDLPRMGPKAPGGGPPAKGRRPTGSSAKPPQGGIVVLEEGGEAARKESRFQSLLEMLRPFKKGAPKRQVAFKYQPVDRGFKTVATEECDVALIEAVAQARATEALERAHGDPYPGKAFEANFAAFKVSIDGKSQIIVARNTENELHSEGWIVKRLEAEVGPLNVPSNAARVKVEQIFTERAPCAGQCEVVISTYFKTAAVFFWVPQSGQRWGGAAKTLREFWLGVKPLVTAID